MTLLVLFPYSAYAICPNGELIITPHGSFYPLPIMLSSPATFTIEAKAPLTISNPNIVLVMTNACHAGLTGPIVVTWIGKSGQSNESVFQNWDPISTGYVPSSIVTPYDAGRYNVTFLKECLGVNGTQDDTLWYNFGSFLAGSPIGQTPRSFTVTLPSKNPRMLILAVGLSGVCTRFFNSRVPPCRPGFIVPEVPPILIAMASFAAVGLYAVKRKRH